MKLEEEEREGEGAGESCEIQSLLTIYPPLTTFAYVLQSLVKPPQIPVNPLPLEAERQSPQLIEKQQILLWILFFSHEQEQREIVHSQSHHSCGIQIYLLESRFGKERSSVIAIWSLAGVSMRLILWLSQWKLMAAELMVMPLSLSWARLSITALPSSTSMIGSMITIKYQ